MRFALILGLTMLLGACGPAPAPDTTASNPSATPDAVASGTRISPPPVTPPTPPGTNLPAFACADAAGGTTGVANTIAARTAEQPGYDRFVLQLDSTVPTYTVKRQATAVFQSGATGQKVTLLGNAGVLVTIHSATGATTFTGPIDFQHPEYQVLLEARQIQDFEGYVWWALGLSRGACLRAFTLRDPARLVIDFQTTAS